MNSFREILPEDLTGNPFNMLGKEWMLITAKRRDNGKYNTMTAAWGGFGVMWSQPVCMCVIRPQRYTFEFVESSDRATFCFFGDKYRSELSMLGTKSGRDCDKIALSGLTVNDCGDTVYFNEASTVIIGRKIYYSDIRKNNMLDPDLIMPKYPICDFHRCYTYLIEKILTRD